MQQRKGLAGRMRPHRPFGTSPAAQEARKSKAPFAEGRRRRELEDFASKHGGIGSVQ
jgi:hypothetical protein